MIVNIEDHSFKKTFSNPFMLLKLKNLRLKTIIGIHAWENDIDREIIINIEIKLSEQPVIASQNIEDTIDYDTITTQIKNLISHNRFGLIETMTKAILDKIMEDERIQRCKVEIDKVGAIESLESASITLEKTR